MRLIDADTIEYTHAIARCIEDGHNWNELCVTKDEIDDIPTIDAVPVVRCKDCERFTVLNERVGYCAMWAEGTETDYFCAYGERRTDVCMDKDVLC